MKLRTLIVAAGMFAFAAPVFAQSDPPGTVILKLSNRNTSERSFSPADFSDEAIVMTRENNLSSENGGWEFALFGSVRGLAYIQRIPENGWTHTIALKPETGYVARIQQGYTRWDNKIEPNYVYVGIYCDSWRTEAGDGGIMGATLKYICPFNPVAAPVDERIFVSGSVSHSGLARWYIEEADINGNGLIENSEMREVRTLGRNFYGMAELPDYLEGLWRFENLEELYLSDSHFCLGKELRVQHDKLRKITLDYHEELEYIDLSGCPNLETVYIMHCALKDIDLPSSVVDLDLAGNDIVRIDLRGLPRLKRLVIWENELEVLIVNDLKELEILACQRNGLRALDLSGNPRLQRLYCYDNPMVALDISANPSITILSVARNGQQNSLQRLYIPAGKTKRDYKGSESGELSWLSEIEVINK